MVAERGWLAGHWLLAGERFGQFRACILVHQMRRDTVRAGVRGCAAVRGGVGQRLVAVLDGVDRSTERTGRILQIA